MCAASRPDCWAIIPARYASSRFPGKPLALIAGTPMVARVAARAGACRMISGVAVATDDERIRKVVEEHGVKAVMTSPDHPSGTDRVLEAARKLGLSGDSVVINVQGDEPGLDPELLLELTAPFVDPLVQVTTPARRITPEEAQSPDLVKVVFASGGDALYFSRSRIPHERDQGKGAGADYYGHVGLYAFRMKALESFSALPPGRLEQVEKLEQLRLLENGIPIRVVLTEHAGVGVDRPEDIERAELLLARETEFR